MSGPRCLFGRRESLLAVAVVTIPLLLVPAPRALGQPRVIVIVDIDDYASVPRTQMDRATAEFEAIFQAAGFESTVRARRRSRSDKPHALATVDEGAVLVHIYPELMGDHISDNPGVLGMMPGATAGGRLVYVFAARVEATAKRNQGDFGTLLGAVLAHEVGHVLLPGRGHAFSGVMRPLCDSRQIRNVALGVLTFTPQEATFIRNRLLLPDSDKPEPR